MHTKSDYWVKPENKHKNASPKKQQTASMSSGRQSGNALTKWFNQHVSPRRKYEEASLKKIEVRSLQNFNL
eukprot:CAMPEP_0197045586 /NCGR_PEP_ID=MMETSP1384-20130603/21418_1 /TAXON_ID=29189 /ORGANISM="Ammonia sp." /LENGTH=70 /DNA_ID=CAMNT_0042477223 /DNA_START=101 /DNA_END=309 /DNA_ORIENTATION=+